MSKEKKDIKKSASIKSTSMKSSEKGTLNIIKE